MDFWTQNSWIVPLIAISLWIWYSPLIDGVCVRDWKLVIYHNKEAKGQKKKLNSRIILMNFWMG
jgi:hypothetical protein